MCTRNEFLCASLTVSRCGEMCPDMNCHALSLCRTRNDAGVVSPDEGVLITAR